MTAAVFHVAYGLMNLESTAVRLSLYKFHRIGVI